MEERASSSPSFVFHPPSPPLPPSPTPPPPPPPATPPLRHSATPTLPHNLPYTPPMPLRILALGDIVGRPGRMVVHRKLPELVRSRKVDLVIANGENIAGGTGITQNLFHKLRSYGVDVVTLGDHVFKKLDIVGAMNSERLVRPANLSPEAAGRGHTVVTTNSGVQVGVFALLGRIFMNHLPSNDPFAAA